MKHSVLFTQNGTKILYRSNIDEMPINTGSLESTKEHIFWNTNSKVAIVEKDNESDFADLIPQVKMKGDEGVPIPYEMLEFYSLPNDKKTYVRKNKNVIWDSVNNRVLAEKKKCSCCDAEYTSDDVVNAELKNFCLDCNDSLKQLLRNYKQSKL